MLQTPKSIYLFFVSLIIYLLIVPVCPLYSGQAFADNIREPVFAGLFYPKNKALLEQTIEHFVKKAEKTAFKAPHQGPLRALIMPHAGYKYSGLTASYVTHVLKGKSFSKIILLGPDHRIGFPDCVVSDADTWQTPSGLIKIHENAAELRRNSNMFTSFQASDKAEHSIEVILPFLQYFIKDFKLVPIVMGPCDTDRVASAVSSFIDKDTLVVASSDLSHYLPYEKANKRDKDTIDLILKLDHKQLKLKDNAACGKQPILTVINLARQHGWHPVLLHYSNSGDTAGTHNRVVGYTAIAFLGRQ